MSEQQAAGSETPFEQIISHRIMRYAAQRSPQMMNQLTLEEIILEETEHSRNALIAENERLKAEIEKWKVVATDLKKALRGAAIRWASIVNGEEKTSLGLLHGERIPNAFENIEACGNAVTAYEALLTPPTEQKGKES